MSELLKGNFTVKNKVENKEGIQEDNSNSEYKKKALESIGGSMVFVERDKLFWDGDDSSKDEE